MNNIILIGMPGVGKSTVGVILAKILGYHFIDSDLVIQQKEHRLLHEIIAEDGLDRFIAIESEVNASLDCTHSVIATGGSVIYTEQAMQHLRSIGKVIYLHVDYDRLCHRLGNLKNRGVAIAKGQTLEDLYKERTPLYEKYADVCIEESSEDPEETLDAIVNWIHSQTL